MGDAYKVLAVEKNGSELNNQEEVALSASNVTFSDANFSATDASAGIIEAGRFGMKPTFASDTTETSTTSTSVWSTKVTLSPTGLPSGNYLLFFNCIVRTSNADREVDVRARDGSTTLWEVRESLSRTQGQRSVKGFVYLTGVSGSKTYTLEFKVGGSATTAFCRDARLAFWRTT